MWVDTVLSDVSFVDRSLRKARLLQWKQRSEPVPAPCPAGPGETLKQTMRGREVTQYGCWGSRPQQPACTSTGKILSAHKVKGRSNPTWKLHNFVIPSSQGINLASLARCGVYSESSLPKETLLLLFWADPHIMPSSAVFWSST